MKTDRYRWWPSGRSSVVFGVASLMLLAGAVVGYARVPGLLERLAQSNDPLVQEVLEDGKVSDDEMETVLEAFVDCVEAEGFEVSGVRFRPGSGWEWSIAASPEPDQEALVAECERMTVDAVGPLYLKSVAPTDAERKAQVRQLVACMERKGVDRSTLNDNDLESLHRSAPLEEFVECDLETTEQEHPSIDIPTRP